MNKTLISNVRDNNTYIQEACSGLDQILWLNWDNDARPDAPETRRRPIERHQIVERRTNEVRGYREPNQLFLTDYGLPLVPRRLSKEFRTAVLKAGLLKKKYTYCEVRHTFAISWIRELRRKNQMLTAKEHPEINDLRALQLLMGHKHRSRTERYLSSFLLAEAGLSDSLLHLFDQTSSS